MPENPAQPATVALRRRLMAALQRPFASLPARIVMSVFVATLLTSLVLMWISTRSIGTFLRQEIDHKFPAVLHETDERLELWYAQREVDVETFSHSRVVVESFAKLAANPRSATRARSLDEVRAYLRYVLERFPQFETLFVLDAAGTPRLWVGGEQALPAELRRELAGVNEPTVGSARRVGGRSIQVASAPVADSAPSAPSEAVYSLGLSLHAIVRTRSIEALLRSDDLGASGAIYLVDPEGGVLMGTPGADLPERHPRRLPAADVAPHVEAYTRTTGEQVVGSSMRFGRFGWTIAVEESYDEAFAPLVSVVRKILAINLGIVILFSAVAFWIARSIVRPIRALSDSAFRIASGETDVEFPARRSRDEIGVLTSAFDEMMIRLKRKQGQLEEKRLEIEEANERLVSQNRELQRVNEVFEQLSITDDLTKLHNHRFFQDHLPQEMSRASRTGESLSLILIDIDDFKLLNDRYGHSVGDAVLRRVADVMSAEVREMDLLARYGGEEFALLAGQTDLEGAAALAEKLRIAVSSARFSLLALDGPSEVRVTVSCGVATYRGDEKAFFNQADRALYRAKEAGKDCVFVSNGGDQPSLASSLDGDS